MIVQIRVLKGKFISNTLFSIWFICYMYFVKADITISFVSMFGELIQLHQGLRPTLLKKCLKHVFFYDLLLVLFSAKLQGYLRYTQVSYAGGCYAYLYSLMVKCYVMRKCVTMASVKRSCSNLTPVITCRCHDVSKPQN